jgi:hypothetical protein
MLPSDQQSKITVEDLLRLKRAERPSDDFWQTFERELRQKQLTALMEKRSWWQEIPFLLSRRAYLPVGATAVLAFTLISVRFYQPAELTPTEVSIGAAQASLVGESIATTIEVPADSSMVAAINASELANQAVELDRSALHAESAVEVPASTHEVTVPMLNPTRMAESPSARSIAANLARLEQSEPELLDAVLGTRLSASARVQNASIANEEFSTVPTGSSRRARLLAQYSDRQLEPEPSAPEIVRERLTRRLDSELNDRITRVGVRGDQVSLRF